MPKKGRPIRRRMPSAPIKAPALYVKGIGKGGQYQGGLTPLVVNPKYGPNSGRLDGQIIGKQGK